MNPDESITLTGQREKAGRELLVATVETFLKEASNEQILPIYNLAVHILATREMDQGDFREQARETAGNGQVPSRRRLQR